MNIVALDIGDKRIGVAATDPLGIMALPVETYFRVGAERDAEYLAALAKSRGAERIVCGLPLNFDGSESLQSAKARRFAELLASKTDIPIVFEDERFTTTEATRVLISADMRRGDRKKVVDKIAASYILEGYLAKIANNK